MAPEQIKKLTCHDMSANHVPQQRDVQAVLVFCSLQVQLDPREPAIDPGSFAGPLCAKARGEGLCRFSYWLNVKAGYIV